MVLRLKQKYRRRGLTTGDGNVVEIAPDLEVTGGSTEPEEGAPSRGSGGGGPVDAGPTGTGGGRPSPGVTGTGGGALLPSIRQRVGGE